MLSKLLNQFHIRSDSGQKPYVGECFAIVALSICPLQSPREVALWLHTFLQICLQTLPFFKENLDEKPSSARVAIAKCVYLGPFPIFLQAVVESLSVRGTECSLTLTLHRNKS